MKFRSKVSTAHGAELKLRRLCTFVAAYEATYRPATDYSSKTYDSTVIGWQFTGEMVMRIGATDHRIQPSTLSLFARGTPVQWERIQDRGDLYTQYVRLRGTFAADLEHTLGVRPRKPLIISHAPLAWGETVKQLVELVFKRPIGWEWMFVSGLGELIAEIQISRHEPFSASAQMVERVRALVEGAPRRDWSVKELCLALDVRRAVLWEAFQRETGQPPATWIRRRRMAIARVMLDQGLGVAEVAARLGFSSRQHFARSYQSVTGHAPSSRKQS